MPRSQFRHLLGRGDVAIAKLRGAVKRNRRAAHVRHAQRLAVVAHFKHVGERPRSVSGHRNHFQGSIAHGDGHPVVAGQILLRWSAHMTGHLCEVPIFRALDQGLLDLILKKLGAAVVVAVGMGKDQVFDLAHIQAEFLQAV